MPVLEKSDVDLLMELQYHFPLSETPFAEVAHRLGIKEEDVLNRARILVGRNVLKRIGMYVSFRAKGMEGALVGASIPPHNVESFRRTALGVREITHNFVRTHPQFNIWFVIKEPTRRELEEKVKELMNRTESRNYIILYSKKTLKLSVKYDLRRGVSWSEPEVIEERIPTFDQLGLDQSLGKALSSPLPIVERPFSQIASQFGYSEQELIDLVKELREKKVVKDYGGTVNGEKAGITENAMVLISSDNVEKSCDALARNVGEATHVVLREADKRWDYLCYCMLHGSSRAVIDGVVGKVVELTSASSYMELFSLDNLKPGIVV
ncbi:AsnC family transcriptional regulator [Sulfodiicoccus acidiphilus]|uniref:siroheme decarboxylase n=1 Tax=Sulfodiicoccus acidiphilus TaxID=1670455 RepID=A0A348B0H7_9CREN|nr:Lrp/AsnC family transcriptional regulator [Sulfodiicoccus acidiphilus]BBD71679.1 AsnC family transcriptional regulator [Sulfodiicoccus acidiphilus]GGT86655.1 AsnC family transcriptional regulator [Sulfodiicoccus acidiphilus]